MTNREKLNMALTTLETAYMTLIREAMRDERFPGLTPETALMLKDEHGGWPLLDMLTAIVNGRAALERGAS